MIKSIVDPFTYKYQGKKYSNFENFVFANNNEKLYLDSASLYSLISQGYIVGDHTMIKNVLRNKWNRDNVIDIYSYNTIFKSKEEIAEDLIKLLSEEIVNMTTDKKNIFILLSGGMDSRVLAALLRNLQKEKKLENKKITGITWGLNDSRDVKYAEKICLAYEWDWHHLDLSCQDIKENINYSANYLGAEVSPIHLHKFIDASLIAKGEDSIILAASYGDSFGRGEYSSVKVKDLKEMKVEEKFGFFKKGIEEHLKEINMNRLQTFRKYYKNQKGFITELEYQNHYMYKMLHNAAYVINYNSSVGQIFTSPKVINYILSLRFECRNDDNYYSILEMLDPELLEMSWARTGSKYLDKGDSIDSLRKNHHKYPEWIKEHFSEEIYEAINSNTLKSLGLFDIPHINRLFKLWKLEKNEKMSVLTDKFIYLLSLKIFLENYKPSVTTEEIELGKLTILKPTPLLREFLIVAKGYIE